MKRIIFLMICLITLLSSIGFAIIYNPDEQHPYNNNIPFTDLQELVRKKSGEIQKDKQGNDLYTYHRYINEILKGNSIIVDKAGHKLIEGYQNKNESGKLINTYSFKPDDNITKGEFIKMAICLANSRTFDYSVYTIPTKYFGTYDGSWAAPYVVVAEMQDIIDPDKYTRESLSEPLTRLDVITILSRIQINMKGIPQFKDKDVSDFIDVDLLEPEDKGYFIHATKYFLIEDMFNAEDGVRRVNPDKEITRGEAIRALLRVY